MWSLNSGFANWKSASASGALNHTSYEACFHAGTEGSSEILVLVASVYCTDKHSHTGSPVMESTFSRRSPCPAKGGGWPPHSGIEAQISIRSSIWCWGVSFWWNRKSASWYWAQCLNGCQGLLLVLVLSSDPWCDRVVSGGSLVLVSGGKSSVPSWVHGAPGKLYQHKLWVRSPERAMSLVNYFTI